MNILNTAHLFAKGRGPQDVSADALNVLGDQLILDPEMLELLSKDGSVESAENFSKVLEGLSAEEQKALVENLEQQNLESAKNIISRKGEMTPAINQDKVISGPEASRSSEDLLKALGENLAPPSNSTKIEQPVLKASKLNSTLNPVKEEIKSSALDNIIAFDKTGKNPQKIQKNVINEANQDPAQLELEKPVDFKSKEELMTKRAQRAYQPESSSMFKKTTESTSAAQSVSSEKQPMKLQDVLFSESSEGFSENLEHKNMLQKEAVINKNEIQTTTSSKVFDMNSFKPETEEQVIAKIQDYILQSKTANESNVKMSFHHSDLGQVDLSVQRDAAKNINIVIGTNTVEGAEFFQQKQSDLLGSLAKAGLNISDFKLESSSTGTNQNTSQDSAKNQSFANNQKHQHNSESGQREQESQKREELWNLLRDKEAA